MAGIQYLPRKNLESYNLQKQAFLANRFYLDWWGLNLHLTRNFDDNKTFCNIPIRLNHTQTKSQIACIPPVKIINLWKTRFFKTELRLSSTDWRLKARNGREASNTSCEKRLKEEWKRKKKNKPKKERKHKKEQGKKEKMSLYIALSLLILLYCKNRYIWESGRETGPLDQVVVPAFVVLAGIPEWVTTQRLLCMLYYFSSMFTLVRETTQHYFPNPQLAGLTETNTLLKS